MVVLCLLDHAKSSFDMFIAERNITSTGIAQDITNTMMSRGILNCGVVAATTREVGNHKAIFFFILITCNDQH